MKRIAIAFVMTTCLTSAAVSTQSPAKVSRGEEGEASAFAREEVWGRSSGGHAIGAALQALVGQDTKVVIPADIAGTRLDGWDGRHYRGQLLDQLLAPQNLTWSFEDGQLIVYARAQQLQSMSMDLNQTLPTHQSYVMADGLRSLGNLSASSNETLQVTPQMELQNSSVARLTDASWEVQAGKTVRATLEAWSSRAGYSIDWRAGRDIDLAFGATVVDGFKGAVEQLVEAVKQAKPLTVVFHEGNKIVEVSGRD